MNEVANVSVYGSVVIPVVVAGLTTAVALLITRAGDGANRRRDSYAEAVRTLVAWVEFPYRVRRRTDDQPGTLSTLAQLGHDLQEQLACHHAWIATESPWVATSYAQTRASIGPLVGAATAEAWNTPPAATASAMNLGAWGPGTECAPAIAAFQGQIERRFGVRRLVSMLRHHP